MQRKKNIVILGSTGSIGQSALDVVRQFRGRFRVLGLAVYGNTVALERQVAEFLPRHVVIADRAKAAAFRPKGMASRDIWSGPEGVCRMAALPEADLVLVSIVGSAAIAPLLAAIRAGKTIALANKEAIVIGGQLLSGLVRKHAARLVPVDSEQSAIFQCLEGYKTSMVRRVYLTASGGPLWDCSLDRIRRASVKKVLAHPRWKMGAKITVDSATLMNKGLEVIEALYLFGLKLDQVKIVIHRQALVHSMVEFVDGSVLAQLGVTNMKLPIQYALTYPERWPNARLRMDPLQMGACAEAA